MTASRSPAGWSDYLVAVMRLGTLTSEVREASARSDTELADGKRRIEEDHDTKLRQVDAAPSAAAQLLQRARAALARVGRADLLPNRVGPAHAAQHASAAEAKAEAARDVTLLEAAVQDLLAVRASWPTPEVAPAPSPARERRSRGLLGPFRALAGAGRPAADCKLGLLVAVPLHLFGSPVWDGLARTVTSSWFAAELIVIFGQVVIPMAAYRLVPSLRDGSSEARRRPGTQPSERAAVPSTDHITGPCSGGVVFVAYLTLSGFVLLALTLFGLVNA